MHLILTGATGLVGSGVLDAMIKMKDVSRISILSRRPVKMAEDAKDPRVHVIIHRDFTKYDDKVMEQLEGAKGCVWALGISQNAVSGDEYVKITKDYALAAADAFQQLASERQPFNFVYVSGDGATLEPGRLTPIFARVKGETEIALSNVRKANPAFRATTVRPSAVDWGDHAAIQPYLNQGVAKSALLSGLRPLLRTVWNNRWSPTEPLGVFLTEMAKGRWDEKLNTVEVQKLGDFPIVENSHFRKLSGLDK